MMAQIRMHLKKIDFTKEGFYRLPYTH